MCTFLSQVNLGLQRNDMLFTIDCLQAFGFKIPNNYKTDCFRSLCELQNMKVQLDSKLYCLMNYKLLFYNTIVFQNENHVCAFVRYVTPKGNESYLDLQRYNYTWDCPKNISESFYVSMEDIKVFHN